MHICAWKGFSGIPVRPADTSGRIAIVYTSLVDSAKSSGIEIE